MFDLITIGDSVVDTLVPLSNAEVLEKGAVRMLSMPLGKKVPVEESISLVGGNGANNAVGASRLGLKTAIYTSVGNKDDDQNDDRIKARFKKEKIDLRYIAETDRLPSNHNIVLNFKGERTILTHHQPWKYHLPDLDRTKWIYLTSLSPSYVDSNIIEQLINYIERVNCKLAFQPGTFQLKMGKRKNSKLLSLSDLFILNKEEAEAFLEIKESENTSVKKLLKGLSDLGVKNIVITDGENGSYGYDGEAFYKLEAFPAKLVEMTGAGDSYATALVAGLIHGKSLKEAMRWGAANSASVVEYVGAQQGLLTYTRMQDRLKEHSKIVTKEI